MVWFMVFKLFSGNCLALFSQAAGFLVVLDPNLNVSTMIKLIPF